ncbi:trifolitoxin immunity protein [Acrocarpospora phusangensis]|uniref:Trifolitoxin immunity protein n=1 Tax=Acrocarpospora phusangensis TaxID=1070424 RepID=A0A919URX0_9ACTN|nr:aminoglycoside phosphotransferase family protein [Acrocarpospora phusangensis]GIH27978.1 trifolitoxin immunity protein [Acrocarpospora phusangensis]
MVVSTKRRAESEIPLHGGEVTEGVVRVGRTVRRPRKPSTPSVHALLRHLESAGFDGAPRVLGVDAAGREILTYIDGTAAVRPLPGYAVTDETLVGLARLLRRYHDAAATFVPPAGALWEYGSASDEAPELIGHCDVTPENVIFRDGRPYALIDFDLARPTTRLFDVVTTLRHWAPIADPLDRDPRQRGLDIGRRLRLFSDAYGLTPRDRRGLLPTARLRFDRSYQAMRGKAESHGGTWAQLWAGGAGQRIRRASAWLDAHEDALNDHLI